MPFIPSAALLQAASGTLPFINVKDAPYRATGDGTTNDTAAIGLARDAAGVNGTVYFPNGTYSVTRLDANLAGQTWMLAKGATIKLRSATNDTVIRVSASGVTITGGVVDGNKANNTSGNNGIVLYHGDDCRVDGVTVQNTQAYGIQVYGPTNRCKVLNCIVLNTDTVGIHVTPQDGDNNDTWVRGNRVDRSSIAAGTVVESGIDVHGNSPTSFNYRTKVHDNRVLMPTSPTSATAICIQSFGSPNTSVQGNHTYGGSMGVSLDTSNGSSVVGNVIFGFSLNGIELAGSDYCSITANTMDGNNVAASATGINGTGSSANSDYNTITGNTVRNLTTSGTGIACANAIGWTICGNTLFMDGAANGITVNNSNRCTVIGNVVHGGNSYGTRIIDGIYNVIFGNVFLSQATASVALVSTTAAAKIDAISIMGNVFQDSSAAGVVSAISGTGDILDTVVVVGNVGLGAEDCWDYKNDVTRRIGTGTPEGVVAAGRGSLYSDRTNGELYVKSTGAGSTGWKVITHA